VVTDVALVKNRAQTGWIKVRHREDDLPVLADTFLGDVCHYDHIAEDIKGRVVIDAGANIGTTVLKALDCGAQVVLAIEPESENLGLLKQNVAHRAAQVEIWGAAVGDPARTPQVEIVDTGGSAYAVAGNGARVVGFGDAIEWGRQFLYRDEGGQRVPTGERIALVKCDVEGGEYAWFDTATADDLRWVDRFVIEFHGTKTHSHHLGPDDGRYGRLFTTLAQWHSVQAFGSAEDGGMIYAHHYRLGEPEPAERKAEQQ
jgi:FkbM family methyltransferase